MNPKQPELRHSNKDIWEEIDRLRKVAYMLGRRLTLIRSLRYSLHLSLLDTLNNYLMHSKSYRRANKRIAARPAERILWGWYGKWVQVLLPYNQTELHKKEDTSTTRQQNFFARWFTTLMKVTVYISSLRWARIIGYLVSTYKAEMSL